MMRSCGVGWSCTAPPGCRVRATAAALCALRCTWSQCSGATPRCYSSSSSSSSAEWETLLPPPPSAAAASAASHAQQAHAKPLPIVHSPLFSAPQLPPGHRFPMQVFQRIHDRLLSGGYIHQSQVHVPTTLPTDAELARVHCPEYLAAFSSCSLDAARVRRIGLGPLTPQLVERTKAEVAGTLLTAQLALQHGLACSTAGGTHHAFYAAGSGFCCLNDLAFTAATLLDGGAAAAAAAAGAGGGVQRVLILDLDVHQGDGTAALTAHDPRIFTLSVHAANNFPARKQRSTLDVPLPDGCGDDEYMSKVAEVLSGVLRDFKPHLCLYDAGVDTHEHDALGRLSLTDKGLVRRELMVLDACFSAGVPLACFVGGGYADDLDVLAERHMLLHRAALWTWSAWQHTGSELGGDDA